MARFGQLQSFILEDPDGNNTKRIEGTRTDDLRTSSLLWERPIIQSVSLELLNGDELPAGIPRGSLVYLNGKLGELLMFF